MRIWCGIDWSERHHDVALVDDEGALVAKRRIPESAAAGAPNVQQRPLVG